jgi:DMSO/TMAO reductase YedYZ molybdopterin-dependent catalytic subunit
MDENVERQNDARTYGRRTFLAVTGVGLTSLFWGRAVWHAVSGATQPLKDIAPGLFPGWRIYTVAATMPTFDERTWRLSIDGLVEKPVSLSYADLRSLPRAEQVSTFHCVTGWTVSNVHWAGVRFDDLLATVKPTAEAHALNFTSAEVPYTDSLTLDQARLHDAMLAYEMDGKPLSRAHGAPVRVVIPDMYGYKNVKWVKRITLAAAPESGFWEVRGYDVDAWVGKSNGYTGNSSPDLAGAS